MLSSQAYNVIIAEMIVAKSGSIAFMETVNLKVCVVGKELCKLRCLRGVRYTYTLQIGLVLLVLVLLSGCVETEVLDETNIISGLGYDLASNDLIIGTAIVPVYQQDAPTEETVFSSESEISQDIIADMQKQSPNPLGPGSMDVVLIGNKLAEDETNQIFDSLQRNPSVSTTLRVAIVDGNAEELLTSKFGESETGLYVSQILQHNMRRGDLPLSNLHLFFNLLYDKGADSYLPLIKKEGTGDKEKGNIAITGVALFRDDKMVGKVAQEDMFSFKLLVDMYAEGTLLAPYNEGKVAVKGISSKHECVVNKEEDKITMNVDITGFIKEYSGPSLTTEHYKQIEKNLQEKIEETSLRLLEQFQELGIDPVAIGQTVKQQTKGFDYKKWKEEVYPELEFTVNAHVQITESGVTE